MSVPTGMEQAVRARVERLLRSLDAEDLEERLAPVKCNKHADHPECMDAYGVPRYAVPEGPSSDE